MPITNLFHKGTSEMSSSRKAVRNPSLKPILVRIGKKFAEMIILSLIPRFCNPCTALTVASVDKGIHNKTTKYGLPTY